MSALGLQSSAPPSQAQVKGEICRLAKCSSVASTHASADERSVLKNPSAPKAPPETITIQRCPCPRSPSALKTTEHPRSANHSISSTTSTTAPPGPSRTNRSAPDWHQNDRSTAVTTSHSDSAQLLLDGVVSLGQRLNRSQAISASQSHGATRLEREPVDPRTEHAYTTLRRRLINQCSVRGACPRVGLFTMCYGGGQTWNRRSLR